MALKAALDASEFETLAEPLKEHYTKDGDGYKLETDIVPEDTAGLKSALQKEREARKQLADQIKLYKDIDPAKAKEAMTKLKELEDKALEEAGEFEKLKQGFAAEKQAAVDALKNDLEPKIQKTTSKLREVMVRKELLAEAIKQGADPEAVDGFVELAEGYVAMDEELNVAIKDGRGSSIAELVKNLSETPKFGVFFKADISTGSGAAAQNKGGQRLTEKKFSESTDAEKAQYISKNGRQKFMEWMRKG